MADVPDVPGLPSSRFDRAGERRVIVIEFVTLDGVVQSPGARDEDAGCGFAHGGWIWPYSDPELSAVIRQEMAMPFDLLLGRRTYDIWARHWPQRADVWPGVNSATKYVVSRTGTVHAWQPTVRIAGDVAERIAAMKREPGPDLHVYGSSELVQTLLAHDLIDALWLKIHPITLGAGKRLFAAGAIPAAFAVTQSTVTPKGVVVVRYERAGDVATRP